MRALVRGLASSFASAITSAQLAEPISLALAHQQHQAYVDLLRRLLPGGVTELPADDRHPDCCFIEDTAVVAGRTAVIARIGAASRQGEEGPVASALAALGCTVRHLATPATLDGGDVLQLPGSSHILVGLSKRTNEAGVAQLAQHLPDHSVHGVPIAASGLHLKSLVTALDSRTLLIADNEAGRSLSAALAQHPALLARQGGRNASSDSVGGSSSSASSPSSGSPSPSSPSSPSSGWHHVMMPDAVAANVLLLGGSHVVMQSGCPTSEALLEGLCTDRGLSLHKMPRLTEFIKADGALTCCSILLPD